MVTPFLPGDSLLFVAGTLAAGSGLDVQWLIPLLIAASFGGDNTNYWIGHHVGPRVFRHNNSRLLNHAYLDRTREFYDRHGGKTVLLARFLPILRTFAPFVAGIGHMPYLRFMAFSIVGSVALGGAVRACRLLLRPSASSAPESDIDDARNHRAVTVTERICLVAPSPRALTSLDQPDCQTTPSPSRAGDVAHATA